jgi:hypothetical protein
MKTTDKKKTPTPVQGKIIKKTLENSKVPAPPPDSDADLKATDSEGFSGTGKNINLSTKKNKK